MTMAGFSFQQVKRLLILAVLSLFSSISLAEVRVIVEYDSTEHRLLRIVELSSVRSAPMSDHLIANAKGVRTTADTSSKVKILWFNADGALISTAFMDDPRLTHAPLTDTDQSPTVVGLDTGAYMVSGPSESAILEIHMPANATLGLDQQFWRMMLVR